MSPETDSAFNSRIVSDLRGKNQKTLLDLYVWMDTKVYYCYYITVIAISALVHTKSVPLHFLVKSVHPSSNVAS